jgi:hypothetical protein
MLTRNPLACHEDLYRSPPFANAADLTTRRELPLFEFRVVVLRGFDAEDVGSELEPIRGANDIRPFVQEGDVDRYEISRQSRLLRCG